MGARGGIGGKITWTIFGAFTLVGLVVLVQGLRMRGVDPTWAAVLMKWGGGTTVIFAIPLFLPASLRLNLSASLVMVALCTFGFNVFLAYREPPTVAKSRKIDEARRAHPGYDHRTQREVLIDLRDKGADAYPALYGLHRLQDDAAPEDLFPLIGVSTSTAVACNEGGQYMVYPTDENGFNNPRGLPQQADIVLVGDSFVQGQCVARGGELAAQLRKRGYTVYSVGSGGNGPLLNLAGLMEYGLRRKPKIVIWGYAGNDPGDLRVEQFSPMLMRYLDDETFTQNLVDRQPEIDAYWKDLMARKKLLEPEPPSAPRVYQAPTPTLKELATLYSLRRMLGLRRSKMGEWRGLFRRVLSTASARVEAAGGKMYFMPFPHYELVQSAPSNRRTIFDIAEPSGVAMLNVDRPLMEHEDPPSLYPLRMAGHLNAKGYDAVAEQIELQVLEPNGIRPTGTSTRSN